MQFAHVGVRQRQRGHPPRDALCQLGSGSGYSVRELYKDTTELVVGGSRFVVLNGISNCVTRPDLADRTLVLPLLPILPDRRRSDIAFWREFEQARPRIFGTLLDALSCALRELPRVELKDGPRMHDFARLGVATEATLGPAGSFLGALAARAAEAVDVVIENDCVAVAIAALMDGRRDAWRGTVAQLLAELTHRDTTEACAPQWSDWPKNPTALSLRIRKLSASLLKIGVEVRFGKASDRTRTRKIELHVTAAPETSSRAAAAAGARSEDASGASDVARGTKNVIGFPKKMHEKEA
jgi:hypothetical protein